MKVGSNQLKLGRSNWELSYDLFWDYISSIEDWVCLVEVGSAQLEVESDQLKYDSTIEGRVLPIKAVSIQLGVGTSQLRLGLTN